MKTFQYKIIKSDDLKVDGKKLIDEKKLTFYGGFGWDLVALENGKWVFKKEDKNVKAYEYKVIYNSQYHPDPAFKNNINEHILNDLGKNGWELVSVEGSRWVFKKEVN